MATPENQVSWAPITPEQATKELSEFVGGTGGIAKKGLLPAPAPADGLGLKAFFDDGTWKVISGGGTVNKGAGSFGNGVLLSFTIAHGLGTADIVYNVRKVSDGSKADCETSNDATNVYIAFVGTPPTLNEFRLVAIG